MQPWQKICSEPNNPFLVRNSSGLTTRPVSEGSTAQEQSKAVSNKALKISAVRQAVDYLQLCIRDQAAVGDRTGALALAGVLEVLHGVGRASDLLIRRTEGEAYEYIASYTELAEEAGAGICTLKGLWLVADVLAATDFARKEEMHTGQLCSYARVEEIYETYYAPNRSL